MKHDTIADVVREIQEWIGGERETLATVMRSWVSRLSAIADQGTVSGEVWVVSHVANASTNFPISVVFHVGTDEQKARDECARLADVRPSIRRLKVHGVPAAESGYLLDRETLGKQWHDAEARAERAEAERDAVRERVGDLERAFSRAVGILEDECSDRVVPWKKFILSDVFAHDLPEHDGGESQSDALERAREKMQERADWQAERRVKPHGMSTRMDDAEVASACTAYAVEAILDHLSSERYHTAEDQRIQDEELCDINSRIDKWKRRAILAENPAHLGLGDALQRAKRAQTKAYYRLDGDTRGAVSCALGCLAHILDHLESERDKLEDVNQWQDGILRRIDAIRAELDAVKRGQG